MKLALKTALWWTSVLIFLGREETHLLTILQWFWLCLAKILYLNFQECRLPTAPVFFVNGPNARQGSCSSASVAIDEKVTTKKVTTWETYLEKLYSQIDIIHQVCPSSELTEQGKKNILLKYITQVSWLLLTLQKHSLSPSWIKTSGREGIQKKQSGPSQSSFSRPIPNLQTRPADPDFQP